MQIRTMDRNECLKVLDEHRLCRIACARDGRPYLVPLHFVRQDNHLYAFSMPGQKIEYMRANPLVAVLVEEHGQDRRWKSVLVEGRYEELPDRVGYKQQRERAWSLLSQYPDWWEPGALKPVLPPVSDRSPHIFFRILMDQVSGRAAE
jgi:nitroimidazol reductase NimA-like FMN-containing flavoprotein (pyridoxamine 5'-phosphate oxidase superfamily)